MASCALRPVDDADFERWLAWINSPDVMEGLDRAVIATPEGHRAFIERHFRGDGSAVCFAMETAEKNYVGNVWLWDIHSRHKRAEVRLFVGDARYRGQGIGREAIELISEYGFHELGLHKLYAYVHEANQSSKRAFEAAGFHVEATLVEEACRAGRFTNLLRMARIARPG